MPYPIVVFSYNRPKHVQLAIEALAQNPLAIHSELYICSDAPRNEEDKIKVNACRTYFSHIEGFKSVHVVALPSNHNVKRAVKVMGNWMSKKFDAWIAIEDDVLVHEEFLTFMNNALDHYASHPSVACVMGYAYNELFDRVLVQRGYSYDTLFTQAFYAFGWGTWSAKWQDFDINMPEHHYFKDMGSSWQLYKRSWAHLMSHAVASKPTSELWDVHFSYEMLRKNMVAVMPISGYLKNIGYDGSGLHAYDFAQTFFQERLAPRKEVSFHDDIHANDRYQGQICLGVMSLWLRAFMSNALFLLKRPFLGIRKSQDGSRDHKANYFVKDEILN